MEVKRRPLLERLRYVLTEQEEIEVKANAAEVARSHDAILHLTREVERLEGLILEGDRINNLLVEARRTRAQRFEARRIRAGKGE